LSFIDYGVPVQKFTPIAEFDGSVIAERTQGKFPLAAMAREYYGKNSPTTDGKNRHRTWNGCASAPQEKTADPDIPILSDDDLKEAEDEGKKRDK
jgi:hypothetical protein